MKLALFVPAPISTVSGGYEYDRRMIAGLRAIGHRVDVIELAGSFPIADDAARQSVRQAMTALDQQTRPLIDGLALPAFAGSDADLSRSAAIIHHPTTLETGHREADREHLHEIERRLLPRLDRVIVPSQSTGDNLVAQFGVSADKITVVVPGTDDAPRCTGSGASGCQVISLGTLIPRKGFDVLMRALARLTDIEWRLTIAGSPHHDPVHAHALVSLADSLGISARVTFAGELTGEALDELWRGADVFALATWWEGYGMAIAEALKRGLPVAVTGGGAAAALLTPEAGVAANPGDSEQLSKALRRLLFSADLRQHMAQAAWELGQTLPSWDKQALVLAAALS